MSLLLLCLSVSMPLLADERDDAHLTGHVLDERTGEHLPYVNVQLKGSDIGTVTSESGHYLLLHLPVGNQTIIFSCMGYETLELPVVIEAEKTIELKAVLRETGILLDNVVVTANRYQTKRQEASTMVNVVSPVVFETTTSACMADALGYQTGLRVEQTCANCGQPSLRINGLEGQYSQILMDSRPIFASLAAVYGLEQIPIGMVDRVEVIRGGGSALYGANAIAGVVNVITKDPTHNFINISNTSQMYRKNAYDINTTLNASVLSENHKIGAFFFAVQRNRRQYDHDGDGFSDIPKLNSTTAGGRVFFKLSAYSKLTLEYHHLTDNRRGGNLFDKEPHETDITEQQRHNIDAGGLTFDWYSKDSKHNISAYSNAQYVTRESYFGAGKDPNAYGRSTDVISITGLQYRFSYMCGWMPADLSAGVEYTYDGLHDKMIGYGRDLRQKTHLYGGYLQNEWKNEMWSLLIGGRLEKHNMLKKPVFTPRLNVRYTPVKGVILRTSYSGGYRAPQAYDEDLHVAAVGGEVSIISLDPNLKPEHSHSVSLSTDLYKRFGSWETNLTAEGFYTYLKDVFFLREDGHDDAGNLLVTRTNAPGAWVGGLNIEGKVAYKDIWMLQLGYTFQKSQYVEAQNWSSDESLPAQKRMLRTPDNYAYMLMNIRPVHDFTISLTGKATGSMLVPHHAGYIAKDENVITRPFWEFGIKLAYDIHIYKHYVLEVNGGVKNVLNQYQQDLDKGELRDADYIYGPTMPRTYFIGLSLRI